ncbi:MAG: magnesium/cobalt transporter CorA [Candidatus Omnitrophica bacterium]|nr:magnesium/cobalt transporter CorA [Candidatus Omnitrophota bacterium]
MAKTLLYCKDDQQILKDLSIEGMKEAVRSEKGVLWLDLISPGKDEVDMLDNVFQLHPVTLEDCINTNTRPKIEQFEEYMFIVMHAAATTPRAHRVRTIELNICLGKNYIITIHQESIKGVETAIERTSKNHSVMSKGADNLLHLVIDSLVDNYMPVLDAMDYKIGNIETQVLENPTQKTLNNIFSVKKDAMYLKRFIGPQRDTVNFLSREDFQFIDPKRRAYFRDVYDNMIFINDTIDTYRDVTNSAFDAYLSTISNRTNDIMKVLTIIATIMMPLTLITGVYGMNFREMPLLSWRWGFLSISTVMILLGIAMVSYFKRKNWI